MSRKVSNAKLKRLMRDAREYGEELAGASNSEMLDIRDRLYGLLEQVHTYEQEDEIILAFADGVIEGMDYA